MKYSADYIQTLLSHHGKTLKKSLGQNFLFDRQILQRILSAAVEKDSDFIVEIGAGVGLLTDLLCQNAKKVVTIEIDDTLPELLEQTVPHSNFHLHMEDVLKTDLRQLADKHFGGASFTIVGNLPYYITAKILRRLILCCPLFDRAVIMVQKEVADRLQSHVGSKEYRAATVLIQTLFDIEYICTVPPHCFVPSPHVDSAVITLTPRQDCPIAKEDISSFVSFVDGAFAARRKQLKGLAKNLGHTPDEMAQALDSLDLSPSCRAEALTAQQLSALFYKLRSM